MNHMQHFRANPMPAELRAHMRAGHQDRLVTLQKRVVNPLVLKHLPSQLRVHPSATARIMHQQAHRPEDSLAGLDAREYVTLSTGGASSPVTVHEPDGAKALL